MSVHRLSSSMSSSHHHSSDLSHAQHSHLPSSWFTYGSSQTNEKLYERCLENPFVNTSLRSEASDKQTSKHQVLIELIERSRGEFVSCIKAWVDLIVKTQIDEPYQAMINSSSKYGGGVNALKITARDLDSYTGISGILYMLIYLYIKANSQCTWSSPPPSECSSEGIAEFSPTTKDNDQTNIPSPSPQNLNASLFSLQYLREKIECCLKIIEAVFKTSTIQLDNGDVSMIGGMMGCFTLCAVAYDILGDSTNSELAVTRIEHYISKLCKINVSKNQSKPISNEWLFGRIGYVYGRAFLHAYKTWNENWTAGSSSSTNTITDSAYENDPEIDQVVNEILKDGSSHQKNSYMWEWHDKQYLGSVHGVAGITTILLDIPKIRHNQEVYSKILNTINSIMSTQYPDGNFPSSLGSKTSRLLQLCHGATGYVGLLLKLYGLTGETSYVDSVKRASHCLWIYGLLKKGLGLCHGIFGNLFPFLQLYTTLHDEEYLYKAIRFAQFGCENQSALISTPDHPLSLFEGIAGSVIVLDGLVRCMDCYQGGSVPSSTLIHMPGFDLNLFM
ncbi:hypothetical protein C9374_004324 [Naegleria lovaniensis]|uniref:Uncharacterized protein n=1 Tax=Naegleria lovaniensis TaxID=51637 RepID=A0AA88GT40_NAELO|nr:uncharacterized protein C9374_004324 [Naegleria lovaniensis]KAG2383653.1 hypothetical protein C9374_004324 [Naegleria lovaniensis]